MTLPEMLFVCVVITKIVIILLTVCHSTLTLLVFKIFKLSLFSLFISLWNLAFLAGKEFMYELRCLPSFPVSVLSTPLVFLCRIQYFGTLV